MLSYFFRKIKARGWFRRPEVMISVPYGVTSVEKRAVHEAAIQAGAREAYLIHEPLARCNWGGPPGTHSCWQHDFVNGGGCE